MYNTILCTTAINIIISSSQTIISLPPWYIYIHCCITTVVCKHSIKGKRKFFSISTPSKSIIILFIISLNWFQYWKWNVCRWPKYTKKKHFPSYLQIYVHIRTNNSFQFQFHAGGCILYYSLFNLSFFVSSCCLPILYIYYLYGTSSSSYIYNNQQWLLKIAFGFFK